MAGALRLHYVNKLMEGSLTAREELQMEIPYSPQAVDAFMLHTEARFWQRSARWTTAWPITLAADFIMPIPTTVRFCMINDFAVAIRAMQKGGALSGQ